jgi:hypothetical protein
MYPHIVPPALRALHALDGLLSKAEAHCEAHKIDPAVLFGFRLYPDMLAFSRQAQLTCDFSARMAARLAGRDPASFPDTETGFPDLHTRVAATSDYIQRFEDTEFSDAATRQITLKMRGSEMTMSGSDYLTLYALPQVYFHLTTAFNILRHNGVVIGKMDYMGAA